MSNPAACAAAETGPVPKAAQPPRAWRRWRVLAAVLAVLAAVAWTAGHSFLTLETIANLHDRFRAMISAHPVLTVFVYVAGYAVVVALSIPSAGLLSVAGGLFFGWFVGGTAAIVAATVGATAVFTMTRLATGQGAAASLGPQIAKLQDGFKEHAFSYLLFLRLVPVVPFCIVNIVPAVLGVPVRTFVWGTLLGIVPATFAIASVGAGLDIVIMAAKAQQAACIAGRAAASCPLTVHIGSLVTPQLELAFAVLSLLALLPVGVKLWRRRNGR